MTISTNQVNHLFIVDASATSIKLNNSLRAQVNDSLDSIKQSNSRWNSTKHRITLFLFHNNHLKCLYDDLSIEDVGSFMLDEKNNSITGRTLDAIGTSIATWRALNNKNPKSGKHQVTIFSAGRDNGSRKYSICTLKTIIQSLVENGWNFTMVSDNALLPRIANQLGIKNYYVCRNARLAKDRNFLITQLKRQWFQRQSDKLESGSRIDYAA